MRHDHREPGRLANNPFFSEKKKLPKDKRRTPMRIFTDDEKRAILADIEMKLRNNWQRVDAIRSAGIGTHQYYTWRREF